jgi:hypothetical protein
VGVALELLLHIALPRPPSGAFPHSIPLEFRPLPASGRGEEASRLIHQRYMSCSR